MRPKFSSPQLHDVRSVPAWLSTMAGEEASPPAAAAGALADPAVPKASWCWLVSTVMATVFRSIVVSADIEDDDDDEDEEDRDDDDDDGCDDDDDDG